MGPSRVRENVVEPEIVHREDAELFLISTDSEGTITFRNGLVAGLLFPLSLAAMAAVPWAGFVEAQGAAPAFHQHLDSVLVWGIVAALVVFATYAVLAYNGLRKVNHRMRRAKSNIDVELKRRHDLIPRIVECVEATAGHERELQKALTESRRQQPSADDDARQAARTVNRQTSTLACVMGVAERYPDLKSDQSFRVLSKTLTRTEKKIALARNYFNDSVTAFNDRIGTFPDLLVAPLCGYTKAASFRIRAFEKHPVSVDLREDEATDTALSEKAVSEPAG
jgi:LemA protein